MRQKVTTLAKQMFLGYKMARREKKNYAKEYCKRFCVPELTKSEKEEIAHFWGKYGLKIHDFCWWRMYYFVTGIHDVRFIPDYFAGWLVYPYYNSKAYLPAWKDKNYYSRFLPNIPMPDTVCKKIRGRLFWNGVYHSSAESKNSLVDYLLQYSYDNNCDFVVKPTIDTGAGKNVKKYHVCDKSDVDALLGEWDNTNDFIIQKCVKQHELLSLYNKDSINIIRLLSWRHDNEVSILHATLRVGIPGHLTDVNFIDGEEIVHLVSITKDGFFDRKMLDQNGNTIAEFDSCLRVPNYDLIIRIIRENHLFIDNFDIIGWDFTIDENETPICFEWNIYWPGTIYYQYAHGPLFADKTEEILSFLNTKEEQIKLIPRRFRAN